VFFTRKKPIIINCYTDRAEVYNYFPVVPNKKIIPDWFKKLKAPYFKTPEDTQINLKLCPGVTGLFKTGFTVPLWSDLFLAVGEKGSEQYRWQYSDCRSSIETHGAEQYGNYANKTEYLHLKLISPWALHCDEPIEFLATEPFWSFKTLKNISILSGVIQFKTQTDNNINMFLRREEAKQEILLEAGTPIYTYVPLTERPIKVVTHLVSTEKMQNLKSVGYSMTFLNHYAKKMQLTKKRKCPYKFDVKE